MEAETEVNEGAEEMTATQSASEMPASAPIQLDDALKKLEGAVDEAAESTTKVTHPPSQVASEAEAIVKEMSLQLSKAMMAGQLPGSENLLNLPLPTTASEGKERKRSSRHQKLVDELTGKLDMTDELKSEGLAWLNTGLATDVKTWQTSAEGIRKLFEVPSAGQVNSSDGDGTELSQPRGDIPQYLPHKTERLPKEWIVKCGRGEEGMQYAVGLSPQNSYEDIPNFPLKIKLSEPDQPWGAFGSVRAIRGSAAQSMSGVPSRYTLQTIGTQGSRLGRSKLSSSIVSLRSDGMPFDPKDEPIWQRGRRFDHVTEPHKKHFITVINTLNYDIKFMEATQATPLAEIKERYRCYNPNIDNYVWKDIFEKALDFDLTLHENGLVDNSYITDDTGLFHFPVIFLFFDDGFLNDPPMQLDIRKAFIRDPDILCRNYQLGMLPEPEEEDLETWCEPDRNIQDMPPDVRREFREKCAKDRSGSKETTELNDADTVRMSKQEVNNNEPPAVVATTTPVPAIVAEGDRASTTGTIDSVRRNSTSSSKAPPNSKAISSSKLKKASASKPQQQISSSNESTNPVQKSLPASKISSKYSSRPSESRKIRASQMSQQLPPEPKDSAAAPSKVQTKVQSSVHAGQSRSREAEFSGEE